MNKLILYFAWAIFGVGCAHSASTRAPDSIASEMRRCALVRGDAAIGRVQGPNYRPVYRVRAPNHDVTFLTVDHVGCAAAGFVGDDTPEGFAPPNPTNLVDSDRFIQCRVLDHHGTLRATDPRTGFTTLTNDEVGCSLEGFVVEELAP